MIFKKEFPKHSSNIQIQTIQAFRPIRENLSQKRTLMFIQYPIQIRTKMSVPNVREA